MCKMAQFADSYFSGNLTKMPDINSRLCSAASRSALDVSPTRLVTISDLEYLRKWKYILSRFRSLSIIFIFVHHVIW